MSNDDIIEVLRDLGMNEEEINNALQRNKFFSKVIGFDVKQMIDFFKTYGLTDEDIIVIENENPYFLTESFVRIRFLEEDYAKLGISDLADLLKKHPSAMSINPQCLHDYIDKGLQEGKSLIQMKDEVMNKYETLFPYEI